MGLLDNILLAYFIIHIPTTILVDAQSVVPANYFPAFAKDLLQWHIEQNGDHLVSKNPVWFVSMVWCECVLQLPFFFLASYAFIRKLNWIRVPCIIYGAHVATTMVPILGDILFGPKSGPKKLQLAAVYAPYLVVPLLLTVRMALWEQPFGSKRSHKAAKRANSKSA